jgi:hypothetical protein
MKHLSGSVAIVVRAVALAVCLVAPLPLFSAEEGESRPRATGTSRHGADQDACVAIDETRDMFSLQDRRAALLMVIREFEQVGVKAVPADCLTSYTLSHVKLGNTINVTLTGPAGQREGLAVGFNDLAAVYSQLVRSFVTGRSGTAVADRTNVTVSQESSRRIQSDSYLYVRLGYGGIFGNDTIGGPALGFGYRAELDAFAIDVSLNVLSASARPTIGSNGYGRSGASSGSIPKIEVLRFHKPRTSASAYVGGGLSWGATHLPSGTGPSYTLLHGSGLQGEFTAGYELHRASTLRLFVQADASLPFYRAAFQTRTTPYGPLVVTGRSRYTPSIGVSLGVGWQRNRR